MTEKKIDATAQNGGDKVAPLGLKEQLKDATPEERRQILDGLPHECGFGKPPKATQFKKGQSGNPKGRPKGTPNLRTVVAEELAQRVVVIEGGRKRKLSNAQLIVRQTVAKARMGDLKAAALVRDFAGRSGQFDEKHEQRAPVFSPEDIQAANAVVEAYRASAQGGEGENEQKAISQVSEKREAA